MRYKCISKKNNINVCEYFSIIRRKSDNVAIFLFKFPLGKNLLLNS